MSQSWEDIDCLACLLHHPTTAVRRTAAKALQTSRELPRSMKPDDIEAWLQA